MHPDDAEWEPWRPEQAADLLAGIDVPWAVAAGWAIDLFLGKERREHEDLELAVPEARFAEVADRFPMLRFFVIGPGLAAPVDTEPERSTEAHHVRPEVVLLFKAKGARPKDESDLAAVLPRLDGERRALLGRWLELVHPGHFWLPDVSRGRVG